MPTGRVRRPRVPSPARSSSASPHSQMPGNPASRVVSTSPGDAVPAWLWDANAAYWEKGFDHLRRFVEREDHARVPRRYEDDGFQLGTWVRTQRSGHKKGRLKGDKITRLEAIPGWVWNVNSADWEEGLEHLRHFVEREGHARVPRKYEDDDYRLGGWVDRQRTAYSEGQLKADRVMRLEALRGWGGTRGRVCGRKAMNTCVDSSNVRAMDAFPAGIGTKATQSARGCTPNVPSTHEGSSQRTESPG